MRTERTEYMMKDLEFLEHVIDQKSQMILDANDRIWEYAELAYHETRSADLLCQILKDEGFSVTTGDAGIPTCFTGTFPTAPESRSWASWGNMTLSPP